MTLTTFTNSDSNLGWRDVVDLAIEKTNKPIMGMLYCASAALWIRCDKTGVSTKGRDVPPDFSVFELRLLDSGGEWRWLRESGSVTSAACVTQGKSDIDGWRKGDVISGSVQITDHRLLWGRAIAHSEDGWTKMGDPRIGPYWLPTRIDLRQSAALVHTEFLGRQDAYGNLGVVEELITGIEQSNVAV